MSALFPETRRDPARLVIDPAQPFKWIQRVRAVIDPERLSK